MSKEDDDKFEYKVVNGKKLRRKKRQTNPAMPRVGYSQAPGAQDAIPQIITASHSLLSLSGQVADSTLNDRVDRRKLIREKLSSGGIFKKFPYKGKSKPHHRAVWVDSDLKYVMWGDINDRQKSSGKAEVAKMTDVSVGNESAAFLAAKENGHDAKPSLCFTLKFEDRTLDLECISQFDRDVWVLTFFSLISQTNLLLQGVDEQKGAGGSNTNVDRRKMSPAVLAQEVDVLNNQLIEKQEIIDGLKAALKAARDGAPTDDVPGQALGRLEAMHEELVKSRQKRIEYSERLKEAESQLSVLREENKRLSAEVTYLRNMREENIDQELRRELHRLRLTVKLSRTRDELQQTLRKEDFVAKCVTLGHVDVPTELLPSPDPLEEDSESSESEPDSDDDMPKLAGNRIEKAVLRERAEKKKEEMRLAKEKALNGLVDEGIILDGKIVYNPLDNEGVKPLASDIIQQVAVKLQADKGFPEEQATEMVYQLLNGVSNLRLVGDTYAALSWVIGNSSLVVIVASNREGEHVSEIGLKFAITEEGLRLSSKHKFRLCDADIMHNGDLQDHNDDNQDEQDEMAKYAVGRRRLSQGKDLVWMVCSAVFVKTLYFDQFKKWKSLGDEEECPTTSEVLMKFDSHIPIVIKQEIPKGLSQEAKTAIKIKKKGLTEAQEKKKKAQEDDAVSSKLTPEQIDEMRLKEREDIQAIMGDPNVKKEDGYYIIDNVWLDQWKAFAGGDPRRPHSISNWRVLDSNGDPVPKLKRNKHYRALKPSLWRAFFGIYGGGPPIPRDKPSIYIKDKDKAPSADAAPKPST